MTCKVPSQCDENHALVLKVDPAYADSCGAISGFERLAWRASRAAAAEERVMAEDRFKKRRVVTFRIVGLLVFLLAAGTLVDPSAKAEPGSCYPSCAAPVALYDLAGSDYDAYRAAREKRMRLREEQRLERECQAKVNRSLRSLERKLDRAEREHNKSRDKSRAHLGSNDGQAGSHCMYGPDGRLIYAPRGETCSSREGGFVPGPTGVQPAVAQGCAS